MGNFESIVKNEEVYIMKENKYDDIEFFNQYKQMSRSVEGLQRAGEWHELKRMLPSFKDNVIKLTLKYIQTFMIRAGEFYVRIEFFCLFLNFGHHNKTDLNLPKFHCSII